MTRSEFRNMVPGQLVEDELTEERFKILEKHDFSGDVYYVVQDVYGETHHLSEVMMSIIRDMVFVTIEEVK